jgi:hypothetical protein
MYTIVESKCKPLVGSAAFTIVDIKDVSLVTIFNTYSSVYVTVTNSYDNKNITFDLFGYKSIMFNSDLTLVAFVETLANTVLTPATSVPVVPFISAGYTDAVQGGYKVDQCRVGVDVTQHILDSDKKDLYITREGVDGDLLHDYCLISVNGYYHLTDTDKKYTYVLDGSKSFFKTAYNHVGILSFYNVGKLTKYKITDDVIYSLEARPLKERCYIKVDTGSDLSDKTILLVMGGYLILPMDNVMFRNSVNSIVINISAMPYVERIAESANILNLASIGVDKDTISGEMIYSDAFIRKYLKLQQSFLVVVDNSDLFYLRRNLANNNFPGLFITDSEPDLPMFVGYGKTAEYWKTYEDGYYAMSARETETHNFVASYVDPKSLQGFTNKDLPNGKLLTNNAFLLEIGTNYPKGK